jgi:serine/threonine protein kinase
MNKHFGLRTKLNILLQIAKGLQVLHSCNIAHMDLKLENILRFEGDQFKLVDLESSLDFSKLIDDDVNIKSSLSIMAPEVYKFEVEKMNTSVDIWSFGMLLFEVITGEVIVDTEDQENGYKIIKSFLKQKSKYVENLVNIIDKQVTEEMPIKGKLNLQKMIV